MSIRIVSYKESPMYSTAENFINTTSRSTDWGRGLSPFLNGPCPLPEGAPCKEAKNIENAWQYAKVYPEHVDEDENPTEEYFKWARMGFLTQRGVRYPMGKGKHSLYSWWNGKKHGCIEARKNIYIPIYQSAIEKTEAYEMLKAFYSEKESIVLWDFDGYDHDKFGVSIDEVINDSNRIMGHAFVLKMMLLKDVGEL